jgi:hypothetical protein
MIFLACAIAAFSLVDPVPPEKMRDLATDRPDLTEGPFTVDAGHLQLEVDGAVFSFEGEDVGIDVVGLNARVGLTDAVDMHLLLPTVGGVFGGGRTTPAFGDLRVRGKWNLIGNAEGDVAVALLPYLVVPSDLVVTGGLILPVNFNLPWELGLGSMVQLELVRGGDANEEIDGLVVVSASLARPIAGNVGAYLEGLAQTQLTLRNTEAWASAGSTWQPTADLQFDLGARARVVGGDSRVEAFAGATVRR